MADFNYKFNQDNSFVKKFDELYKNNQIITQDLKVYFNNNTITHISDSNKNSITILGHAYNIEKSLNDYLINLLSDFCEDNISDIKRNLHGQYIAIVIFNDYIYIFSDFLQVRSIYYSIQDSSISSSFDVISHSINTYVSDIDNYKIFEYLAMKNCFYPTWIGNSTINKKIKRLSSCEYLKINIQTGLISVKDIVFSIDNVKINSLKELRQDFKQLLENIIYQPDFKEKSIALTLTGGFDSRSIAFIAKKYYHNSSFRVAVKKGIYSKDLSISKKLSEISSTKLNVYEMDLDNHKEIFYGFTDGLSPKDNVIITPIILNTDKYDLCMGGAFGTELFNTIDYSTVNELIKDFISNARKNFIGITEALINRFEESLREEFDRISKYYILKDKNDLDLIRLFMLIITGNFSSPMISSYNIYGNNFEPYGTFPSVELGMKISLKFMGNKKTLGNHCLVQKALMEDINKRISRVRTTHYSPMIPLKIKTLPFYISGYLELKKEIYKNSKQPIIKINNKTVEIDDWKYTSADWAEGFFYKMKEFGYL